MKPSTPDERLILHFTHVNNLPKIIADGAVYADAVVGARLQTEVGDLTIKARRRTYQVTCGPGGHPCDYVPFYFAPRSPMLYKIAIGGVPHYQDGQNALVYLVSTIGDVTRRGLPWAFSNGNCGAFLTEYFDDLALLDTEVDWVLQHATMWHDTADDPTRATRRAAEFLVHERFPWTLVRGLVVRTTDAADAVRQALQNAESLLDVAVRPRWYYNGARYR